MSYSEYTKVHSWFKQPDLMEDFPYGLVVDHAFLFTQVKQRSAWTVHGWVTAADRYITLAYGIGRATYIVKPSEN